MKRKYRNRGICLALMAALMLTACRGGGEDDRQAKLEAQKLTDSIRQKYDEKYEYTEPIRGVARDGAVEIQMNFDIMNSGFTEYTQIVNVYQDSEFKHPVGAHFDWDEERQVLSVTPPLTARGAISAAGRRRRSGPCGQTCPRRRNSF